jgi:hypothetical protein
MLFCVTIRPTPKVLPWNDFPVTLAQVELGGIMMVSWLRRTWVTFTGRVGQPGRAHPVTLPARPHREPKLPDLNPSGPV